MSLNLMVQTKNLFQPYYSNYFLGNLQQLKYDFRH